MEDRRRVRGVTEERKAGIDPNSVPPPTDQQGKRFCTTRLLYGLILGGLGNLRTSAANLGYEISQSQSRTRRLLSGHRIDQLK